MNVQLWKRYSSSEIMQSYAQVYDSLEEDNHCFYRFESGMVLLVTIPIDLKGTYFSSLSHLEFEWPRSEPKPAALRYLEEYSNYQVFARTEAEQEYRYLGSAKRTRYGYGWGRYSARLSLEQPLPSIDWFGIGGRSVTPAFFAAIPRSDQQHSRYHQKTLDLLGINPPILPDALQAIERYEQANQIRLPAAVREWYSLAACQEIMKQILLMNPPAKLDDQESAVFSDKSRSSFRSMMPIAFEEQGVHIISVPIGQSDDPPVYLAYPEGYSIDEFSEWAIHAEHFSEFLYARAFACRLYLLDYMLDVSNSIVEADIEQIRASFELQAVSYEVDGFFRFDRYEHYAAGDQRIRFGINENTIGSIQFTASSPEELAALLKRPWSNREQFAQLAQTDLRMQQFFLRF